jgi:hypothetical protein
VVVVVLVVLLATVVRMLLPYMRVVAAVVRLTMAQVSLEAMVLLPALLLVRSPVVVVVGKGLVLTPEETEGMADYSVVVAV